MSLLSISGLRLSIGPWRGPTAEILRGVDLELTAGRIQGLAGESGSGKTMTGLAVMGLLPEGARATGNIMFEGRNLLELPRAQLNSMRGTRIGMVFQDPSTSLHPMISVGGQLTDHMRHHLRIGKKQAVTRAVELLASVRVRDPEGAIRRYPHQFSGGQRQRIAIAIALACNPKVLIADEPTTALDVTVQAGVLSVIRTLATETQVAVLFVTHDLGVMSAVADDLAVMRNGVVVEAGSREQVFHQPRHAYTKSLLAALPGTEGGISSLDDVRRLLVEDARVAGATGTGVARSPEPGGEQQ